MPAAASGGLSIGGSISVGRGWERGGMPGTSLRHEDGRRSCARLLYGLLHGGKDRQTEVRCAGLLGICATNNLRACANGIRTHSVETAVTTRC